MAGTLNFLEQRHPAAEVEYRNWQKAENSQNHPQPIFEWRKVCVCALSWLIKFPVTLRAWKYFPFWVTDMYVSEMPRNEVPQQFASQGRGNVTWRGDGENCFESGLTLAWPSRVPHPPAEWWCKPHRGWPLTDGRYSGPRLHHRSQILQHRSQILHHRSQILHPRVCCFLIEKAGWK